MDYRFVVAFAITLFVGVFSYLLGRAHGEKCVQRIPKKY